MTSSPSSKTSSQWCPFYEEPRPSTLLWEIGNYRIVRCAESGLVYLANPLSEKELEAFYSLEYFEGDASRKGYTSYAADENVLRTNFRAHVLELAETLKREGNDPSKLRLLDYGCAYGYFLDESRDIFGEVEGIEVNDEVAQVGRDRYGLKIDSRPHAIDLLEPESFDVVAMWDVIEHLQAPRSAFVSCARVLKPGGILSLTTGDIDSPLARMMGRRWRLINPPQHISYFSLTSMKAMLDTCGFDVLESRHSGKRVSFDFMVFILGYMLGMPGLKAPKWLSRKSVSINLFDVMKITARKR